MPESAPRGPTSVVWHSWTTPADAARRQGEARPRRLEPSTSRSPRWSSIAVAFNAPTTSWSGPTGPSGRPVTPPGGARPFAIPALRRTRRRSRLGVLRHEHALSWRTRSSARAPRSLVARTASPRRPGFRNPKKKKAVRGPIWRSMAPTPGLWAAVPDRIHRDPARGDRARRPRPLLLTPPTANCQDRLSPPLAGTSWLVI